MPDHLSTAISSAEALRRREGDEPLGDEADAADSSTPGSVLVELVRRHGPLIVLIVGSILAIRFQMLGRGSSMIWAWSSGVAFQMIFGMGAFITAAGAVGARRGGLVRDLYALTAVFVAADAVYTFVWDWPIGRFAMIGVVHALLMAAFFRFRPAHMIFIIAVTFLVKIVGMIVVRETWYTWF